MESANREELQGVKVFMGDEWEEPAGALIDNLYILALPKPSPTPDCGEEFECKNGGTPEQDEDGCVCACMDGWKGDTCEEEAQGEQECWQVWECQNGGTPAGTVTAGCSCECMDGWQGDTCEEEAQNVSCQNLAQIVGQPQQYSNPNCTLVS